MRDGWVRAWRWRPYARWTREAATIPGLSPLERSINMPADSDLSTLSLSACSSGGIQIPSIRNGRVVR
jgi:hypothetical protein